MFSTKKYAEFDMDQLMADLEKQEEEAAKVAQARNKQKQMIATTRAKSRRNLFGFGMKKKKNTTTSSTSSPLVEDSSRHSAGGPTVATADETQADNSRRPESPLSVPSKVEGTEPLAAGLEQKTEAEEETSQRVQRTSSGASGTKTTKKKRTKSKPKRAYSVDAPTGVEERNLLATASSSDADVDVYEYSRRSTRSNGSADVLDLSGRSGRSNDNHFVEASNRSSRSNDFMEISTRSSRSNDSLSTEGRRRPRRKVRAAGSVPKFLESDESNKEKGSTHHRDKKKADALEKSERSGTGGIVYFMEETMSDASSNGEGGDVRKGGEEPPPTDKDDQVPTTTAAKKKPILRVADAPEGSTKEVTLTANDEEEEDEFPNVETPIKQNTIVVPPDFDDDVTCLTMDDFDRKPDPQVSKMSKRKSGKSKNSSSSSITSEGLTDAGLSEILRKDIHSKKQPVLLAALEAIGEFASKGSKQRSKVSAFGAIPSMLRIMEGKKTTRKVLVAAFTALELVTRNDPKNQETACELNAISTISFCMQRQFLVKEIVLSACKTLETMTSFLRLESSEMEDPHQDINTNGAMTVLSCCLMSHLKDKDILAHAIGATTNICMYRPDEVQRFSESGGISAMTAALQKKWKSKALKAQAQADFEVIAASVEPSSSDNDDDEEEEEDEDSDVESSEEEEEEDE